MKIIVKNIEHGTETYCVAKYDYYGGVWVLNRIQVNKAEKKLCSNWSCECKKNLRGLTFPKNFKITNKTDGSIFLEEKDKKPIPAIEIMKEEIAGVHARVGALEERIKDLTIRFNKFDPNFPMNEIEMKMYDACRRRFDHLLTVMKSDEYKAILNMANVLLKQIRNE